MVVGKLSQFETNFPEHATACDQLIVGGEEQLAPCRCELQPAADSEGDMIFDFEVLKIASMLTGERSVSGRHDYVSDSDLWAIDPKAYKYPY